MGRNRDKEIDLGGKIDTPSGTVYYNKNNFFGYLRAKFLAARETLITNGSLFTGEDADVYGKRQYRKLTKEKGARKHKEQELLLETGAVAELTEQTRVFPVAGAVTAEKGFAPQVRGNDRIREFKGQYTKILKLAEKERYFTRKDVERKLKLKQSRALWLLKDMTDRGMLAKEGVGKATVYTLGNG
jgi:hypothetical protein